MFKAHDGASNRSSNIKSPHFASAADELSTPPSNALSLATGKLVSVLEVTDPRYDVGGGLDLLYQIPKRLGQCEVLDLAASLIC